MKLALAAVRRLADRFPHALYAAGVDPNELEIAFSNHMEQQAASGLGGLNSADNSKHAEYILLDAIKKRNNPAAGETEKRGGALQLTESNSQTRPLAAAMGWCDRAK